MSALFSLLYPSQSLSPTHPPKHVNEREHDGTAPDFRSTFDSQKHWPNQPLEPSMSPSSANGELAGTSELEFEIVDLVLTSGGTLENSRTASQSPSKTQHFNSNSTLSAFAKMYLTTQQRHNGTQQDSSEQQPHTDFADSASSNECHPLGTPASVRRRPINPQVRSSSSEPQDEGDNVNDETQDLSADQLTKEEEASLKKEFSSKKFSPPLESQQQRQAERNSKRATRAMMASFTEDVRHDTTPEPTLATKKGPAPQQISLIDTSEDESVTSATFKALVHDIRKRDRLIKDTIINNRYKVTSDGPIGSGSFGEIYEVEYLKTGVKYALKVIPPRFKRQAVSEQKYLTMLQEYERHHVVRFEESFVHNGKICFIFELLTYSLYGMLEKCNFQGFKLKIVQIIGRQILNSLEYLGGMRIIHCDLKPENILLCPIKERHFREEHLRVKLIDFGSACNVLEGPFIKYIQSRFYRAPEVILGHRYSYGIDLWSAGCILYELHTGSALFPGENETEMIQLMVSTLGVPPTHMLHHSAKTSKWFTFNSDAKSYELSSSTLKLPRESLRQKLRLDTKEGPRNSSKDGRGYRKHHYEAFHDVLEKMLRWDPQRRSSLRDLLRHPFFTMKFDA